MSRAALLALLFAAACQPPVETGSRSAAVGEVQAGFPNPWERALFMAANRARSDPATVKGAQSTVMPPQAPLVVDQDLNRSSRFHATMLEKGGAPLMHPSPCTLKADVASSGCDGSPSCGCTTGATCMSCGTCAAGTDTFQRIGMFRSGGGGGEIAAAGYGNPWTVMDGWVDEAAGADGHRQIVDSANFGMAGFGHSEGASGACWPTFDVGDFAYDKPAPAKIASAAPNPIGGGAGVYRVYATWNDPAGGAPASLYAVVDGNCTPLAKELGDPKLNATYFADVTIGAGCHSVYILGHDSGGGRATYPTTTAFTIDAGGGNCADETAQPQAACDGTAPPDLGGTGPGDPSADLAGAGNPNPGNPNPGNPNPGNPNPGNPNPGHSANPSGPTVQGGCDAAPGRPAPSLSLLALAAAWMLARAARRRHP